MTIFGVSITQGQITVILSVLGGMGIGLITLYWRLKTFWYDREQEYLRHVQETIAAQNHIQTSQLEACLHKIPGHPEGVNDGEPVNGS